MRIGYYAHHHGSGHCRQADKLAALLPLEVQKQLTVFTSLPTDAYPFTTLAETQIVRLNAEDERADDVLVGRAGQYWQPASLHYSPVGNYDIQTRSWQIINTIHQRQIDLMIIDVSAEVAMLCRAASVPYLYVRLPGERDDSAHISAFTGALGLLAPFPKELEAASTPDWVKQKTLYLDFLPAATQDLLSYANFTQLLMSLKAPLDKTSGLMASNLMDSHHLLNKDNQALIVTVIKGYGGHKAIDAKLPALRRALPKALIISLGPIDEEMIQYVDIAAEVDDVTPFMAHSNCLIMACGLNGIAQAYPYDMPLVVLPDARPHREQEVMAEALIAQGRALSWQQFMRQLSADKVENVIDLSNQKNAKVKNETDALASSLSAQAFITSLTTYAAAKPWFEQWLLPQLGLEPEK